MSRKWKLAALKTYVDTYRRDSSELMLAATRIRALAMVITDFARCLRFYFGGLALRQSPL